MKKRIQRKTRVISTVAAWAVVACFSPLVASDEEFTATVEEVIPHISGLRSDYHAWPNMTRLADGRLAVAYNGGREGHVGPFGRIEWIHSADDGRTWASPRIVADSPTDDRDGAITQTAEGTLIVNWFTSQAWLNRVDLDDIQANWPKAEGTSPWFMPDWTESRLNRWMTIRDRLPREFRSGPSRGWMARSEDGGLSWSEPYEVPVHNTHGLTPLRDGRILILGRASGGSFAYASADDGKSWDRLAPIPLRPGDNATEFHELHAVQTRTGRVVCHIRNHNSADQGSILQTVSDDGGRSWSVPVTIGVPDGANNPSHLLVMQNGDLMMTYGHRVSSWRIETRISRDDGENWSQPVLLYDRLARADMGYPSTVEVAPLSFVTVWYETPREPRHEGFLQAARWTLVYPGAGE